MDLFDKIGSLRKANLTPMQMFNWVFDTFLRTIARFCAINIFSAQYKPSFMTLLFVSGINSYFLFFVWMLGHKDIISILQASTCINLCVQGMIKYATLYFYAADMRANVAQLRRMYSQNASPATANYQVLSKWSGFFIGISKMVGCMFGLVGVCMTSRPAVVYLFTQEQILLIPIWVPGVDETNASGYTLTSAYHVFVMVLAYVGTIGSDTLYLMFVLHIWPMYEIFENTFRIINESARVPVCRDSVELKRFIRNAIQMHSEMCSFSSWVSKTYSIQSWIEVNSNGFSLCMCFFCTLTMEWKPAYFLGIMYFIKLFLYCLMGTVAEIASDRIVRCIEQSNWYLLGVIEQRYIQLMILRAHRQDILTAGVEKLNLNLFAGIMKTVYSVSMLLAETVGN